MILWIFIGILYLIILTWQDINSMKVDDRYNYFMFGLTASLYAYHAIPWWFLFIVIGLAFGLGFFMTYAQKYWGRGDLKTFLWSFIGFAIIDITSMVYYLFAFTAFYTLYILIVHAYHVTITKQKPQHIPGYPILLMTFCVTAFAYGLFKL